MSQPEKMCEDCAGGGSRWVPWPPTSEYELIRASQRTSSFRGNYVHCDTCDGKGFIPVPFNVEAGPYFCETCGEHPASSTPKGMRCHMCWTRDVAADNPVPLPDGEKCLEDLASIGVPGAAEKLKEITDGKAAD